MIMTLHHPPHPTNQWPWHGVPCGRCPAQEGRKGCKIQVSKVLQELLLQFTLPSGWPWSHWCACQPPAGRVSRNRGHVLQQRDQRVWGGDQPYWRTTLSCLLSVLSTQTLLEVAVQCTGRHRCTWSGAWLQLTIARVYIALWPQGSCLDRARANFKVHLWNLRIRTIWWCAVMLRRALFYEHEYFCCGESPWTATESERANIYDEIFILYNSIMFPLVV